MAHILCVDDDDAIVQLLKSFIESLGHRVTGVSSVDEAMRAFLADEPDMVLTDLIMPFKDGYDLLRAIKAHDPKMPVIIITGSGSVEAAVSCLKTGASDFLSKPLELNKLEVCIRSCLDQQAMGSEEETIFFATSKNLNVLPGYNIKNVIGMGFSSVVYLAEETELPTHRQVALKILKNVQSPHMGPDENIRRFTREARVISQIDHPNIVKVFNYDVDSQTKLPYIAMEYVPGATMKDRMEDLQLQSIATRLRMILEIASALHRIHGIHLYHRDIKPHNIMLTNDLTIKLGDFSLVSVPHSELTMPLQILGTPAYMAPESFYSADVDGRADLFSLGVVAYELLTGQRPFEGKTHKEIADAVQYSRPIAPRELNPQVPADMQRVLAGLLCKTVEDRYPDVDELIDDLNFVIAGDLLENPALDARDRRNLMDAWRS